MDRPLYSYSPIKSRPPRNFPDGARLAFYIGLNIERFHDDVPLDSDLVPDPMAHGWRDGNRVGVWRLMDLFDDLGMRASGIINSEVCTAYPEIIEAGVARNWAWVAHGKTNSVFMQQVPADEEKQYLDEVFASLDATLPASPRGWLGPGLGETSATPQLLRDGGLTYLLDWCCDDPFPLTIPGLWSVPYSIDVNDWVLFVNNPALPGPDYERIVLDQFEQLLEDSVSAGRVMALPLHTFITGQPGRAKYLKRVLKEITSRPEVWVCTSDDIADHYVAASAAEMTPAG